jgi:hypothetical protein
MIDAGEKVKSGQTQGVDELFALFMGKQLLQLQSLPSLQIEEKGEKGRKAKPRS